MDTVSPHARKSNPYSIYALIDPRDGAIRYIGMTRDIYQRMRQHSRCVGDNSAKNAWIEELQQEQLMFIMHSLEKVKTIEQALARELYWIDYYQRQGAALLNRTGIHASQKIQARGFIRYSTSAFLCKLFFYDANGEHIRFTEATTEQFLAFVDRYIDLDDDPDLRERKKAQEFYETVFTHQTPREVIGEYPPNGIRCRVLNRLRLANIPIEIYNHRGERVIDLVGNPLLPQK